MKGKTDQKPNPGVDIDDEVFFNCQKTRKPRSGTVLAHGKHGATIKADGEKHKVRWEHILGHKTRAIQQCKMVEHGEDGAIVKDKKGRHRFIAGEIELDDRKREPGPDDVEAIADHLKKAAPLAKSFDAPVLFVWPKRV